MSVVPAERVRERLRALDQRHPAAVDLVTLFVLPTAVLAGIYFLWPASEQVLEYEARDPTVVGILGSNVAHRSLEHLVRNLAGLWLFGGAGYLLARNAGERNLYRLSFLAYVTVLPFLASSFIRRMLVDSPDALASFESVGFSGVVGALAGFLAVAIAVYYHRLTDGEVAPMPLAVGLFFGGIGVVFRTLDGSVWLTAFTGGIGVLTLLYIGAKATTVFDRPYRSLGFWSLVGAITAFHAALAGLFDPRAGGGLYAHVAGYWWGFLLAGVLLLTLRAYRRLPEQSDGRSPVSLF